MFTPNQYRAKATEYGKLAKSATSADKQQDFREREQSFTDLADNEQWLEDNHENTVRATAAERTDAITTESEEEHVLRCLGAALVMQWNTLPKKLQRELFDIAGTMGEMLKTAELRGHIARFLHKHTDDKQDAP